MEPVAVHQAIHGYRDGHRLLSSSISLGTDSARSMLILSDLSGPSMQLGFDDYLTAYPLQDSDFFVFAKTWYAPEMERPGCVWTHSLLINKEHLSHISANQLLASLRRPQLDGVESQASFPILIETKFNYNIMPDKYDEEITTTLLWAVLGQTQPIIVPVDTAKQVESAILRIWDDLWPSAKAHLSFCTGALMPRTVSGVLMDLQAVPRSVPPSQFRKSASQALLLDLRLPINPETWLQTLLEASPQNLETFRLWLESVAGRRPSRKAFPSIMKIFGQWFGAKWSAYDVINTLVHDTNLENNTRSIIIEMVFDRAESEGGLSGRRELLQELCLHRDVDLALPSSLLEDQTKRIFSVSRNEGHTLVLSLLGGELTKLGEFVLRTAVCMLEPTDLEMFWDNVHMPFLPTIVGANPALAMSPRFWVRARSMAKDVLGQLQAVNLSDRQRGKIVSSILESGCDVPADSLVNFGGKVAFLQSLTALANNQIQFSLPWRSVLSGQPELVVDWLESHSSFTIEDLNLCTRLVSPKTNSSRLLRIWHAGITNFPLASSTRVAAFGLALALADANTQSELLAGCFQPTYDAARNSRLEYEEWGWLQELAPAMSWWRDWDKCERLAAALARLFHMQETSLETVFRIVNSRHAIRKIAAILGDGEKDARLYLKMLRRAAETSPGVGSPKQREALLEF